MGKKNITGGNKSRKQKRDTGRFDPVYKLEPEQMFAQIVTNNGSHFTVLCSDNVTRLGRLTSSLKKGPRLVVGSFVVVSLREFEAEKKNCDIIAHGSPPTNILNIFQKNNPVSISDIDFCQDANNVNDENENENDQNNKEEETVDWEKL